MGLSTYDFNIGAYENVKGNVLANKMARNRWGNKFKRLYVPYKDEDNKFDFTVGVLNCVGTDIIGTIEELNSIRGALDSLCQLSNLTYARESSFFSLLVRKNYAISPTVKNIKVSISQSTVFSDSDSRSPSVFLEKNITESEATAYLEPLFSYYTRKDIAEENLYTGSLKTSSTTTEKAFSSRNPFFVNDVAGNVYGYLNDTYTFPTTTFNSVQNTFGVEDLGNPLFLEKSEYEARFSALMQSIEPYLIKFLNLASVLEDISTGQEVTVVYPVNALDFWLKEIQDSFLSYYYALGDRSEVELDLIKHLGVCDTLKEQIGGNAGEIRSIWFEFKKTVSQVDIDPTNPYAGYDPNYHWWEEKQFDEIRKKLKNFKDYFDYIPGSRGALKSGPTESVVVLKAGMLEQLSGNKIFWLVSIFLNVDSYTKKRSFLEGLFSFVLLVVAIYLTVITENPVWLKILLVGTTILSSTGALSPKVQLIVTLITFAYGAYNTNYSSLSGMELFQVAIQNIDMVMKMKLLYDEVKMNDDNTTNNNNELVSEEQDKAMEYIYTHAYSQYDELYSLMYDYEPNYKNNKG